MIVLMPFEAQDYKEIGRDIYDEVRDGDLTEDEREDILGRYEDDCRAIQGETCEDLQELRDALDIFEESTTIQRENIRRLQKIISAGIDGHFGPGSFVKFEQYKNETGFEGGIEQLLDLYMQTQAYFNALPIQERKNLQREGGKDGVFGPNTFRHMLSQDSIPQTGGYEQIVDEFDPIEVAEPVVDSDPEEINEIRPRTPGDHHPEIVQEETEELLDFDEKLETFQSEAEGIHRVLIKMLQQEINTPADGDFGPNSAKKAIETHPEAQSLIDIMREEGIPVEGDGVLPMRQNTPESRREVFREMYGEYVDVLEENLHLPNGLIEAIIRQETQHGTYGELISHSGCKGMMQLSGVSITDMLTDHRGNTRNYRESFQNLELERLLSLPIGGTGKTIQDTIPAPIVETLQVLNNPETTSRDYNAGINTLKTFIKGDSTYFNHAVNMILGSIYLSGTYHDNTRGHGGRGDVRSTADLYNAAAGERVKYRNNVVNFYNQYHSE